MQRRVRACGVGFAVQTRAEATDRDGGAGPIGLSRPRNPATGEDDTNKVSENGVVGASAALAVLTPLPVTARRERQGSSSRLMYRRYPQTDLLFVAPPMMATMMGG